MISAKELSVRQTARELDCTLKYVFDLLYAGKLVGATKIRGKWRIPSVTVTQWRVTQKKRQNKGARNRSQSTRLDHYNRSAT